MPRRSSTGRCSTSMPATWAAARWVRSRPRWSTCSLRPSVDRSHDRQLVTATAGSPGSTVHSPRIRQGGKPMARRKLLTRLIAPIAIVTLSSVGVATGAGAAPDKAPAQTKGTLVIGNISNATGTTSLPSTGSFDTLKAWAKDVNSRGGVNGYKISVKTADDKADPAKASEAIKTLTEDDHAIAIVGQYAGGTASVWQPIADSAGVPIIGGGCYDSTQNADQNFYCVTTTAILDGLLAQAKFVADQGGKKFGITYDSS